MPITWTTPPEQLLTTALLQVLNTEVGAGCPIGDHEAPREEFPRGILYALPGGSKWAPSLDEESQSIGMPFQVSIAGTRRDQAQYWRDRVNDVLVGSAAAAVEAPAGWEVRGIIAVDAASGVQVEGKAPKIIFTATPRYTLYVTPA